MGFHKFPPTKADSPIAIDEYLLFAGAIVAIF